MQNILTALKRAAADLLTPRMLALALWPMGLSLLFWTLLAWWFGATWKLEIMEFLSTTPVQGLMQWAGAEWLMAYAAISLIILLWLPAVYTTALLITSLALMPMIITFVAGRHYPELERRQGGTALGSVLNGLLAMFIYMAAWLIFLPLWLFAPFGILVSILLNAWLNQRLFMYDALSEHASSQELNTRRHADSTHLYTLSALLGLLHFIPVLNFFAPLYMALAFTHFGLNGLAQQRQLNLRLPGNTA